MDARKPWTNELCKWTRFESLFRDDSKFLFLESRNSPNSSREYSSIACCYRDRQESEFFLEKYCFANSWWWEFNYPGRKQFRFSQPDERFFSRRDNVESVYIYTRFFYPRTVKVLSTSCSAKGNERRGMRIGGAGSSSARCRVARISRSRDVYDFMGQLPWYTAS